MCPLLQADEALFRTQESADALPVKILRVVAEADGVISLELARGDGTKLPPWQPGAHIDVLLPSGKTRQYSLCGDPEKLETYRIAVLREAQGRGGSVELHEMAGAGAALIIRPPRNRFPLIDATRYLFIAGGIGVTPLLPMAAVAERRTRPWTFIYGGRSRATMAFINELSARGGGSLRIVPQDEAGHPAIDALLRELDPAAAIYACGPSGMLAAVETSARGHCLLDRLHVERFAAPIHTDAPADRPFDVILQRSGRRLHVPAGRTLASVLQQARADVSFSCEEGYCGTCETTVIAGTPEHRDSYLSAEEKARNDRMMVCVGRSLSATLIIDA
jgi:ferredoxin-NADP reductase